MDDYNIENIPSNYVELTTLCSNKKSEILLAKSSLDNKIYVKKILKVYNREVYEKLKELKSVNLPKIYEIFEEDGRLTIIEEFINGSTIEDILKSGKVLDEETALGFMINLCDVLELLHSLKPAIIHRDIKPSNVIINNDRILKLIDYDVSRIYKEDKRKDTVILGTVGYASPEQLGFDQTDGRTDIYAMGVLLNVMIVGKHPIEEAVQGEIKKIVAKCTMLIAEDRYQSVGELKRVLEDEIERVRNLEKQSIKVEELEKENCEIQNKVSKKSLNLSKKEFKTTVDLLLNNKNKAEKDSSFNKTEFLNLDKDDRDSSLETIHVEDKRNWFRKNIPGFRTDKGWKMTLAILGYAFIAFGMTMNLSSGDNKLIISDLALGITLLLYIALFSNFLGIANKLPLLKREGLSNKICGYLLYSLLIMIVFGSLIGTTTPIK